ncbi:AI-2E family transporter [Corynebacterium appendicis]|uniref:AI-2E family transporter n=1 Tax=Corynebacterium appendicis TaxID=163202 RepID=UPI0030B80FA9
MSSAELGPAAGEDAVTDDAQALAEKVQATDARTNGSGDVHEYANRVDRSVIVNAWTKSAAQFSLRMLIIVVLLGAAFYLVGKFWAGVLPVILALIVCTVLSPITNGLRRLKVPGGLAALFSLLVFFAVLVFFVAIILPDILRNSRVLVIQAGQGIQGLQLWLQNQETLPFDIDAEQVDSIVQDVATWMQDRAGAIAGGIFSGISTATSMSITLVVVVVLTFFFLKDGPKFLPWVRSATGGRAGLHATELLTRAWDTLGGYIRAQAVVSLIDALFIGIGIWIVGVPMAFTLAVITFMAGFIPLVGAIVAGALAVLIALVSLGFTKALIVLAIVLAVQQLEGNVLSPLLQSRAMKLHPVIVLVSVTVGGGLFGLVGAFLAVPVAATVAVVFRYIQDMLRLHAGEVSAADLSFATDVGRALAEAEERESDAERTELLSEHVWTPPTLDGDDEDRGEPAPRSRPGSTLVKQVKSMNLRAPKDWRIENVFGPRKRGGDDVS